MFIHFQSQVVVVQEGLEPMPRCDLCGMQIPAGGLIKHLQTERCNSNMQMMWKRHDLVIKDKCLEVTFSLTG